VLVALAGVATVRAQETRPAEDELTLAPDLPPAGSELPRAPDNIDEDLADAAARPPGLLKYGPVNLLDPLVKQFNKATEQYGLNVGFAWTAVYQAASGGPGKRDAAGEDFDLFGSWRLLGAKDDPMRGALYFAAESRNDLFTEIAPAALGGQIGSLWGTTNGFGEQVLTMKELYWQQHFGGDRLIVRVGKLDPENYYNNNYWQSDSKYFLNKAFSSFPVRAFPGNGLGTNITAKLSDEWYISTGVQDAQGKKTTIGANTLFDNFDLFGAGEVGFTPNIKDLGRGNYRFTGWYRAAGETDGKPHDAGFDISFDQHINEHLVPFFRYGWGEGNINGVEHMISTGIGWEGDLITQSDVVGIGGMWGRPANHDLDDQYGAELFYRLQLSPDNQFTVGYQVIIDPVNEPNDDVVGVFEVRWRVTM
jgi:porin